MSRRLMIVLLPLLACLCFVIPADAQIGICGGDVIISPCFPCPWPPCPWPPVPVQVYVAAYRNPYDEQDGIVGVLDHYPTFPFPSWEWGTYFPSNPAPGVQYQGWLKVFAVALSRKEAEDAVRRKKASKTSLTDAAATIIVTLPPDATLTVDDKPTRLTSGIRTFVTPDLPAGEEYHYTLKGKVVRAGRTQSATREAAVRAGETTRVEFDTLLKGESIAAVKKQTDSTSLKSTTIPLGPGNKDKYSTYKISFPEGSGKPPLTQLLKAEAEEQVKAPSTTEKKRTAQRRPESLAAARKELASRPDCCLLAFKVAEGADVVIDWEKVNQDGRERIVFTPPLQPGRLYYYTIKVRHNGQTHREVVTVQANQTHILDYAFVGAK